MRFYVCLLSLVLFCASGCSRHNDYQDALDNGRRTIPWVVTFDGIYPNAYHSITHYNIKGGDRLWQSEVFLYGRYSLTVEGDVKFDSTDHYVVGWGKPRYYLIEYTVIDNVHTEHSKESRGFEADEWNKLESAKGDIGVLGVSVKKISPVPRIEKLEEIARARSK